MKLRLKPLDEQVLVITGADSGIGLATARLAAERGASVVLCSRNAAALAQVADGAAMQALAQAAVDAFGRIDTWVNNAGLKRGLAAPSMAGRG